MNNRMDNKKIIEKIKKCLALSKSPNEYEAAQALKHAQKLMEIYGLNNVDIELGKIAFIDTPCNKTFSKWQLQLLGLIQYAFGCGCYQKINILGKAELRWYGFNNKAEIASYAYEVLLRQIKKARREFMNTHLKRVRVAKNKTLRGDKFCEGWVLGTAHALTEREANKNEQNALDEWLKINLDNPKTIRPRTSSAKVANKTIDNDLEYGFNEGKNHELHTAINESRQPKNLLG